MLYTITIFIIKLSTLCLWHRLFPGRGFTTALYAIGGVLTAYSITQLICVVTQCVPLSSLWDPSVPGTCINLDTVFVVCSSFNIATDFCILVLPIFQLLKLKVSTKQKLQLTIMFCLGGFVLVISIIRIPQLTSISQSDQSCMQCKPKIMVYCLQDLGTLTDSAIWTSLECAVATLSACLPTMRPLFSRLIGHKPQDSRPTMYTQKRSGKLTWSGRNTRRHKRDGSLTDTQPITEDEEAGHRSYIPLDEVPQRTI